MTNIPTEKQIRFTVLVPVDVMAYNAKQLARLFGHLQNSGPGMCSSDGYSYSIRTERIRLRDLRAAFKTALKDATP